MSLLLSSFFFCSTVPNNYNEVLDEYTRQGYRVIALAHRLVEIRSIHKLQKVQREDLEEDLTFLGMLNCYDSSNLKLMHCYFHISPKLQEHHLKVFLPFFQIVN